MTKPCRQLRIIRSRWIPVTEKNNAPIGFRFIIINALKGLGVRHKVIQIDLKQGPKAMMFSAKNPLHYFCF